MVVIKFLKGFLISFIPQVVLILFLCIVADLLKGIAILGIEVIANSWDKGSLEPLLIKVFPGEVFKPGMLTNFLCTS
jgi:hypothetical protein